MSQRFRIRTSGVIRAAAVACVLAVAAAGCGGGTQDDGDGGKDGAVPPAATGTLEQLAAKVKCEPNMQTDAEELRQANCETEAGRWVMITFKTETGKREWIDGAKDYGGEYLVGKRWVAVGDRKVVTALRGILGGELETGTDHSQHSGTPSDGASHSGH
ncbi:hypothetical protein [Streptomyces sp. GC420]|uniref:hypothetical protein n=1 Tax=Streptomyces sp. GC420 TaxID=2697568 RepID=UPI0014150520|nr:hypothetical protein [Streptomyces sp. GC420]NBM19100.1 hypothetical protein [Streptomyces sp. GC420]